MGATFLEQNRLDLLGVGDLPGCGRGLLPGGVGFAGSFSEEALPRGDAGDPPEPGLRG